MYSEKDITVCGKCSDPSDYSPQLAGTNLTSPEKEITVCGKCSDSSGC
ncbi:MAG: hypothetical protein PHH37_01475 [Paludibacter sp.]|nr:hypothetical protein [Paludibacter sp.]